MISFGQWKMRWQRSWETLKTDIMLFTELPNGRIGVIQPNGMMLDLPIGEKIPQPSFSLDDDQMQALMDGLWEMGGRPKNRRYETEIDLLKDHLGDFKKLIFEKRIKE